MTLQLTQAELQKLIRESCHNFGINDNALVTIKMQDNHIDVSHTLHGECPKSEPVNDSNGH